MQKKYWNRRMSEETNKPAASGNGDGFEREDMSARAVFSFLVGLALVTVVIYFILQGMYRYLDAYEKSHQPPQNPLAQKTEADTRETSPEDTKKFPQPRLESNERRQLNDVRRSEEETLNSYGWVDQKSGVVHIPIERAMELVAQRGLPVHPASGVASPVPTKKGRAVLRGLPVRCHRDTNRARGGARGARPRNATGYRGRRNAAGYGGRGGRPWLT